LRPPGRGSDVRGGDARLRRRAGDVRPKIPTPVARGDEGEAAGESSDNLEDLPYQFFESHGWTPEQFLGLTLRQVRYYRSRGKVQPAGYREFSSLAEVREYRAEQDRLWADFDWEGWACSN
jgi:hypothetical protein